MTISEKLLFNTVRIEAMNSNCFLRMGTSFILNFFETPEKSYPVLVTNRHVIENSTHTVFSLNRCNENGYPILNERIQFCPPSDQWINHPSENIDLCILPLGRLINPFEALGINLYYTGVSTNFIPSLDQMSDLDVIEDIVIIGYPDNIRDEANNFPIFRRGITATHIYFKHNGKDEFVIDSPIYNGSSGSPVYIINQEFYVDRRKGGVNGSRCLLVGVVSQTYEHVVDGVILDDNDKINRKYKVRIKIPNNLGLAINALKLLDFESSMAALADKPSQI